MTGRGAGWALRASRVIPGGSSTGSKRPEALFGHAPAGLPTHYRSAHGCRLVTADGGELVDFTMSLGAVALGYADEGVSAAVAAAVAGGNVCGLPHTLEVELAERLVEVIPCAEQVRFMKSGAEGMAAAIRIARTATGRDLVLGCGYFGWLDWCSAAAGVPRPVSADFRQVPFGDVDALERAVEETGGRLAAIALEPIVERLAPAAWVQRARDLCERSGAVLVFDEVKTGFRLHPAGYQGLTGVRPHLAVFGKALANGLPLSAVVGERGVMEAANRTWISSTLAGETVALAAAGAVLDRHASQDVCGELHRAGIRQMEIAGQAISRSGADGVVLGGIPEMWFLRVEGEERQAAFSTELLARGVLLKRGAYNFPSLAHDAAAHDLLATALAAALRRIA